MGKSSWFGADPTKQSERLFPIRNGLSYGKKKGPAMPAGVWGMTGLPANSLSKGDGGERRGIGLKSIFEGG